MDILAAPAADAAVVKCRVKRITGAREVTATEHREAKLMKEN